MMRYPLVVWRLMVFTALVGFVLNIPDVLFNFYLVSLGFDNVTIASFASILRMSGFVFGIPIGLAVDRFGGTRTVQVAVVLAIVVWICLLNTTNVTVIQVLYFLSGVLFTAQGISILPSLARVSSPDQRAHLYGMNFSVYMVTSVVSALLGGMLPHWVALAIGVDAMSVSAYRGALYVVVVIAGLALLPLVGVHRQLYGGVSTGVVFARVGQIAVPWYQLVYRTIGRFGIGFAGGLFQPFINMYLRQSYAVPDSTVGLYMAVMGIGSVVGGVLAARVTARYGGRRGLLLAGSVAGLLALSILGSGEVGFVVVYTILSCVISMIYPMADVLVMGSVAPAQRGFANSISGMMWSLGWASAAWLSGVFQATHGFVWPIVLMSIALVVTGLWFWFVPLPVYVEHEYV